jgi:hypothetical protein
MSHRRLVSRLAACMLAVGGAVAEKENRTRPGKLVVEPPTLINLGFEWLIGGRQSERARPGGAGGRAGSAPLWSAPVVVSCLGHL